MESKLVVVHPLHSNRTNQGDLISDVLAYILHLLEFSFHSKWSTVNVSNCLCFSKQRFKDVLTQYTDFEDKEMTSVLWSGRNTVSVFVRMCFSVIKRETKKFSKKSILRLLKAVFCGTFSVYYKIWFYAWPHLYFFMMNAG